MISQTNLKNFIMVRELFKKDVLKTRPDFYGYYDTRDVNNVKEIPYHVSVCSVDVVLDGEDVGDLARLIRSGILDECFFIPIENLWYLPFWTQRRWRRELEYSGYDAWQKTSSQLLTEFFNDKK